MEIRVEHALAPAEVARRIGLASAQHGVEHDAAERRLAKRTPLGRAEATYDHAPGELVLRVTERPAFLPEGMIRRAVEEKLRELLASAGG
jgi:hypothetical protein